MKPYQAGALAGITGTLAHTLVMLTWFRFLPRSEQYPVPPREITTQVARKAGVSHCLSGTEQRLATWINHFAYGALTGALYPAFRRPQAGSPVRVGILYGLLVWAVSYLGWLPKLGILKSATKWPPGRNAMMIAAHVAWGGVTGVVADRLTKD